MHYLKSWKSVIVIMLLLLIAVAIVKTPDPARKPGLLSAGLKFKVTSADARGNIFSGNVGFDTLSLVTQKNSLWLVLSQAQSPRTMAYLLQSAIEVDRWFDVTVEYEQGKTPFIDLNGVRISAMSPKSADASLLSIASDSVSGSVNVNVRHFFSDSGSDRYFDALRMLKKAGIVLVIGLFVYLLFFLRSLTDPVADANEHFSWPVGQGWKKVVFLFLSLMVVVFDSIVLTKIGVPVILLLLLVVLILIMAGVGAVILRPVEYLFGDIIHYFITCLLMGCVAAYALNFVFFHTGIMKLLGLSGPAAISYITAAILLIIAVAGLLLLFRRRPHVHRSLDAYGLLMTLAVSSVMAISTCFGFSYIPLTIERSVMIETVLPSTPSIAQYYQDEGTGKFRLKLDHWSRFEIVSLLDPLGLIKYKWASQTDKGAHLVMLPAELLAKGMPTPIIYHNGVQVFLAWVASVISGTTEQLTVLDTLIKASKPMGLIFWFSLLYLFYAVSRGILGSTSLLASLVVFGAVSFASINYPFFQLQRSSYLGLLDSSGTLYHNTTQLYSVTFGLCGIMLFILAMKRKAYSFFFGCILVCGSFFFKPSLFTVVAPAIFILSPVYMRNITYDKIRGYVLLLCMPIFWAVYPQMFGMPAYNTNVAIEPMALWMYYSVSRFPDVVTSSKFLFTLSILGLSCAVFVPVFLSFFMKIRRFFSREGLNVSSLMRGMIVNEYATFTMVVFILGIVSGCLLVENNGNKYSGNFGWATAAGILLILPVLVKGIADIRSAGLRFMTWLLFALHIWGGILHWGIFVFKGRL